MSEAMKIMETMVQKDYFPHNQKPETDQDWEKVFELAVDQWMVAKAQLNRFREMKAPKVLVRVTARRVFDRNRRMGRILEKHKPTGISAKIT